VVTPGWEEQEEQKDHEDHEDAVPSGSSRGRPSATFVLALAIAVLGVWRPVLAMVPGGQEVRYSVRGGSATVLLML
jgi:hypothetical protein